MLQPRLGVNGSANASALRSSPFQLLVALVLLVVPQGGCFSEGGGDIRCEERNSLDCCLKYHPGMWEHCTGMTEAEARVSGLKLKALATGTAVAVAASPVVIPAERRGVELAVDLRRRVDQAIARCTQKADREVNDFHLKGVKPSRELCQQIRIGQQTWAAYLGLLKHGEAWLCLREALDKVVKGRYLLYPRFQLNPHSGRWEYMDPNLVSQIVYQQGWKGLMGTIEPDIVILDANGVIILVYDMKFPCPEDNLPTWDVYTRGPWLDMTQEQLYIEALRVSPLLVSPRHGVELP